MKRTNIHLTASQIVRLKAKSDVTGLTLAELVRRAIDHWLAVEAKKKGVRP